MMQPKLRVLVLPGYLQNAALMDARIRPICEGLSSNVELVVIEPPHVLHTPTNTGTASDDEIAGDLSGVTSTSSPRAWWFSSAEREKCTSFKLFDETVQYLRTVLEEQGPFDAVFGFSQGAATATILTTLLANPKLHPIFAKEGRVGVWPPKQFKFAVLVSGYLPMDSRIQPWFAERPLQVPSLHVMGTGDTIISNETSLRLREQWANTATEWHHGGHFVPNKAAWRTLFRSYLESFLSEQQIISTSPAAVPQIEIAFDHSTKRIQWCREIRRVYGSRSMGKSGRHVAAKLQAYGPAAGTGYGQHVLLFR